MHHNVGAFVMLDASEQKRNVSMCVRRDGGGCCELTPQHVEKSFWCLSWEQTGMGSRLPPHPEEKVK